MSHRFGEMRHFMWFMAAVTAVVMIPGAIIDPEVPISSAVVLSPLPVLVLTAYALYRSDNHGRGRTWRSRAQRVAARAFVGPINPCGCWQDVDAESVERDHYVARDASGGGKVRFEARKRVLKRCHGCGRHYHVDRSAKLKRVGDIDALAEVGEGDRHFSTTLWRGVDVWPEDEPAAREALTAPVEDREVDA
jgi:hypothetical protein